MLGARDVGSWRTGPYTIIGRDDTRDGTEVRVEVVRLLISHVGDGVDPWAETGAPEDTHLLRIGRQMGKKRVATDAESWGEDAARCMGPGNIWMGPKIGGWGNRGPRRERGRTKIRAGKTLAWMQMGPVGMATDAKFGEGKGTRLESGGLYIYVRTPAISGPRPGSTAPLGIASGATWCAVSPARRVAAKPLIFHRIPSSVVTVQPVRRNVMDV